jgi:hypothetical protein
MSQSILVRKLCTLSPHHPTRKAVVCYFVLQKVCQK